MVSVLAVVWDFLNQDSGTFGWFDSDVRNEIDENLEGLKFNVYSSKI